MNKIPTIANITVIIIGIIMTITGVFIPETKGWITLTFGAILMIIGGITYPKTKVKKP